jgi:hypothetical protein
MGAIFVSHGFTVCKPGIPKFADKGNGAMKAALMDYGSGGLGG